MKPMPLVASTTGVLVAAGVFLVVGNRPDDTTESSLTVASADASSPTSIVSTSTSTVSTSTTEPDPTRVVPDTIGLAPFEASRLLLDQDLEFTTVEVPAGSVVEFGTVVRQSPAPGAPSMVGDVVEISVGRQPEPATTPGVTALFADGVDGWALSGLESGRCYNGRVVDTITEFDLVDCATPHEMQLEAFEIAFEGPYDTEAVRDAAMTQCEEAFEEFVGVPIDRSQLGWTWSTPRESAWVDGDRIGHCLILAPSVDQRLRGTAKDSLW